MISPEQTFEQIKEYYGKTLKSSKDLKNSVCCPAEKDAYPYREILNLIDEEIKDRFYGCGSPIPPALSGCTVLDLGCGSGRDVYLVARLVGERGRVIGIDMTAEQLAIAERHLLSQMTKFNYSQPNVVFQRGYIEDLKKAGIEDRSIDVVISNCVINLSPDKKRVFAEIFRVLKPGGELFFSDIFADRRIPAYLESDPSLYGECLSGALYLEDFRRLLAQNGCLDYRVVTKSKITLSDPLVQAKAGMINFYSMTIRVFNIEGLEDRCEDFGQIAVYEGTLPEFPHQFLLDDQHVFFTGKPQTLCGNTAAMLEQSRYKKYFKLYGDRTTHFGLFPCGSGEVIQPEINTSGACC